MSWASSQLPVIVGLLCNFRQEKAAREDLTHRDFIEWLENHRHEEVKTLICRVHNLQGEIDELFRQDHEKMLGQLQLIGSVMSQIMSRLDMFSGITQAISPAENRLTEQEEMILLEAAKSYLYEMSLHSVSGFPPVLCIHGRGWEAPDPRFLVDDLESLLNCGLIKKSTQGRSGYPLLRLTRYGAKYAEILAEQKEAPLPVSDATSSLDQ